MTHTGLIIDTHTHIYPMFDVSSFLSAAAQNLKTLAPSAYRAIILTERVQENVFSDLKNRRITGGFTIINTSENASVAVKTSAGKHLSIISGKQVNSYEGLEVLALGTHLSIPDRKSLRDTISFIRENGAVPVVPWSFGKWVGRRKKVLLDLIESSSSNDFLIGDIIGRGGFLNADDILSLASQAGLKIIQGTDPLPMTSDAALVGKFASLVNCSFDRQKPAESLNYLWTSSIEPRGKRDSSITSLRRQAMLRLG